MQKVLSVDKGKYGRFFIWPIVLLYVAALPYAIVVFDYLKDELTLPIVKVIPLIVILVLALIYVGVCRVQGGGYKVRSFIFPSIIMLVLVVILESNTIKYFHIPQYILLTWLIYLGLSQAGDRSSVIVVAAIYASLFGVVDEVHQGVHPARYFGWKDMFINIVGSTIGALALISLSNSRSDLRLNRESLTTLLRSISKFRISTGLIFLSLIMGFYSISKLFIVSKYGTFFPHYPFILFAVNLCIIGFNLAHIIGSYKLVIKNQVYELLFFWPLAILSLIHVAVVYAYGVGVRFE